MRLVSLCPSITETLVALGLRDDLVGVTRYCVHPREAVRGLRRVGGTKSPDLAAIRELAPDLVFLNAEENRGVDIEALASERTVDVSHPKTVAEVPELIRHFGRLTGREAEAGSWACRIEHRLAGLDPSPSPFRFLYLIWLDPWMAAAPGTYIDDVVSCIGGRNVLAAAASPYPTLTAEELTALEPEVVILPDEPYPFAEKHVPIVSRLVPDALVTRVAGDDFCWHGVRTLRGIDAASDLSALVGARVGAGSSLVR